MRRGSPRGFREQYGENGGGALAAPGSSFEKEFTISPAGVARHPMPRRRGRFLSSEGKPASTKEGASDCGWGPSPRSPCSGMERRNPARLAAAEIAEVIDELLFRSLGIGGTRRPTNAFDDKATSSSKSWSIGPQFCRLWAISFAGASINCSSINSSSKKPSALKEMPDSWAENIHVAFRTQGRTCTRR